MNEVLKSFERIGIIPVVVLDDAKDAEPLGAALMEGGLPCAEVTFRTDAAEESIRIMAAAYPDMLVGAGTVLTTEQVDRAVDAGAKFIVSPGFDPKVVRYCIDNKIPVTPGTNNASTVQEAIAMGLDVVKFFPAETSGGLAAIKAIGSAFPKLKFMPTGGINEKNVNTYLDDPKILACGGSWMVKGDMIAAGEFEKIKDMTSSAVKTMLGFEIRHVGVNCDSEAEAKSNADRFGEIFGFETKTGGGSVFSGTAAEFMKKPYLGAKGHIAIGTNNVERAYYHLKRQGVLFNEESVNIRDGVMKAAYLKDEIGGFAVHIVGKK